MYRLVFVTGILPAGIMVVVWGERKDKNIRKAFVPC